MSNARLRWRCRRGVRELDIALQGFLENDFRLLTTTEQRKFEELLEVPDPSLMDWIYGRTSPSDAEFAGLIERIRDAASHNAKNR